MKNSSSAPMGLRFLAYAIDFIIIFLVTSKAPESKLSLWDERSFIFYVIVWALYFIFLQSWFSGTFGKRLVGIKIVSESDGLRPTYTQCLKRTIFRNFSIISFMYGYYYMYLNNVPQTWHDEFADTIVIKS